MLNERLCKEIKKVYPQMVVDYEFRGEVLFYTSEKLYEEHDPDKIKSGFFSNGRLVILDDF